MTRILNGIEYVALAPIVHLWVAAFLMPLLLSIPLLSLRSC